MKARSEAYESITTAVPHCQEKAYESGDPAGGASVIPAYLWADAPACNTSVHGGPPHGQAALPKTCAQPGPHCGGVRVRTQSLGRLPTSLAAALLESAPQLDDRGLPDRPRHRRSVGVLAEPVR